MIIAEPQAVDASDTVSIATLVAERRSKIPSKLIYASLLFSLISFIFTLVDNVTSFSNPNLMVPTILAFGLTLPHNGISLLLTWLQEHQSESILPFNPHSRRSIEYSILLTILWIISTVFCGVDLNHRVLQFSDPQDYWSSIILIFTSSIELILIVSITVNCYRHRISKSTSTPSSDPSHSASTVAPTAPELKVISA